MAELESHRLEKLWLYEQKAFDQGYQTVAGVDEAGRGPLAGPVMACACILPPHLKVEGIDDSKKLSPSKRQKLFEYLTQHPDIHYVCRGVDAQTIDEINIYQATQMAMLTCLKELQPQADKVLVDGMNLPPPYPSCAMEKIIKGDSLSCSIAAASIIAKQTRDQWMLKAHEKWPEYGFKEHKGYGTAKHKEALKRYGPCPIHRKSYAPIAVFFKQKERL